MTARPPAPGSAHRAVVTLITVPDVASDDDRRLLSDAEQARANRFAVEPARTAFVTARAAVRRLLGRALCADAADVRIAIGDNGRPRLDHADSTLLDFNLSHSGSLIAIIVARGHRAGIDIEWHGHDRGLQELVPTVMSPLEAAYLRTQRGANFTRAFLDCWTRKEALLKADGVGLGFPLQQIEIPTLEAGRTKRVTLEGGSQWCVTTLAPHPEYSLSVALDGNAMPSGDSGKLDLDVTWQSGEAATGLHESS